ncbi:pantoate--beta-alanine ligase [Paenibacillus shunpengii]|uniref:Pantothenate synthetase n=1 Tax=Paenibacillus shunpengii TaxID=2054424 RepID=A0ABW5SQQ3_9BACL|nr:MULTISPECIES: pantoate--beta-alanine ligase [unclassified Paenibacillus]OMC68516.1 pantoate--beta-alanine ligase [Paenibacillus sp. FSL H7-0326]SDW59715.1 pantoate--beta-alanine ligase [Paenibacillus sp. PDC88]
MITVRNIEELRAHIASMKKNVCGKEPAVGLVPTMGFLHEGHASLMREARKNNDIVVLSIFVNPIQFGPNEDFETYPRDEQRDLGIANKEGIDIVFIPTVEVMYPHPTKTKIRVADITDRLCGASRPGHFDGVTTVVAKLFNIVQPNNAYFGMKDAQQVAVLSQMVSDLNMPINIVPCPIVREADGLALSSRNVYLNAKERNEALVLSRSLRMAQLKSEEQEDATVGQIRKLIIDEINTSETAVIDYVDILTFPGLEPIEDRVQITEPDDVIIALAVKFGKTRLIDNHRLQKAEVLSRV